MPRRERNQFNSRGREEIIENEAGIHDDSDESDFRMNIYREHKIPRYGGGILPRPKEEKSQAINRTLLGLQNPRVPAFYSAQVTTSNFGR